MPYCGVKECFSSAKKGIKLYQIPRNTERKTVWLELINRQDLHFNFSQNIKICEVMM